ncbi:hypothetical protein [Aureibacillus halotolerans]|uniref:YolD-like protein n=1 Tax=Aureibacillus halotolerans TaxID=1508390 RepID=A0A4R6UC59_9BACI|nr:hypothetical protein [Aureibacillus halotolerans]TDQ42589.1 hypothetical protein EV213_10117 [Aureibacillus halotolerans]
MRTTRQWFFHPRLTKKDRLIEVPDSTFTSFASPVDEVMLEAMEFGSQLHIVLYREEQYHMFTGRIVDQNKNRLRIQNTCETCYEVDVTHIVAANIVHSKSSDTV